MGLISVIGDPVYGNVFEVGAYTKWYPGKGREDSGAQENDEWILEIDCIDDDGKPELTSFLIVLVKTKQARESPCSCQDKKAIQRKKISVHFDL